MKRRFYVVLLLGLAGAVLLAQHQWRQEFAHKLEAVLRYLHALGTIGIIATAGVQFLVAVSGVIPASILGVAAGAAYGFVGGFAISATGVMAGALAAFLLSRSAFRPLISRYLHHRAGWHDFDRAIARDGWRFVCLIRLSPVMPFAIASYSLGISSIRLKDYLLGTVASLPALGLYVFFGTLAHTGLVAMPSSKNPWSIALLVIGAVATVVLSVRIGQIAMRASSARIREAESEGS